MEEGRKNKGHMSFRENKRTKGLCEKIRQQAEDKKRPVNDYMNLLLEKAVNENDQNTLTFTKQALWEICEEIVKKQKKAYLADPSRYENVMWDSLADDWMDWIEDKSLEELKTKA